jgi:hypothetical protein
MKRRNLATQFTTRYCQCCLKIDGGNIVHFSLRPTSLQLFEVYDWYDACAPSGENKKEDK